MLMPPQLSQKTDVLEIKALRKLTVIEFGIATRMALASLLGLMAVFVFLVLIGWSAPNAYAHGVDSYSIYYVASDGNCGVGVEPCYGNIQAAVDAADDPGDVVKVAAGRYTGIHQRDGITQVVYISKTVTVRGGYTATNWSTPDPKANPTTVDAQGLGRVLVITGTVTPTVEGLRMIGGDATGLGGGPWGNDGGGGIYVCQSNATLAGNMVATNTAGTESLGFGGGMLLDHSGATLISNTVQDNTASTADQGEGGGLCLWHSAATLTGNRVVSNLASVSSLGYGGGLSLYYSNATLQDNIVQSNTASMTTSGFGGGLYLSNSAATLEGNIVKGNIANTVSSGAGGGLYLNESNAIFQGNMIVGNIASTTYKGSGGGLHLYWSAVTFEDNKVISNTATTNPDAEGRGGGLYVWESNPVTMTNNVVASNHANTEGGGLWMGGFPIDYTSGRALHNTIVDNAASYSSGQGVYVGRYAILAFTNTIIAGHSGTGITVDGDSTVTLEGTLWYANGTDADGAGTILTGTVNVHGDPAFVDPATWNYRLGPGSAAIDAGVSVDWPRQDMDGNPRPDCVKSDIGAFEVQEGTCWRKYLPLALK